MSDNRGLFVQHDSNDVEAWRHAIDAMFKHVALGDTANLFALRRCESIFRFSVRHRAPCFHFDEDQFFTLLCNDVNLTTIETEISLENMITLFRQVLNRKVFTCAPPLAVIHGYPPLVQAS